MLHITNGDVAVARMREGGLPGGFLPWQDLLHEGPVPATDSLARLTSIRAHYLAQAGYGSELKIHDQLKARDARLARAAEHDEVVLWFEHDLYDQLQLLQLLDWLAANAHNANLSLIVIGRYPGIARFVGLGQLTPEQVAGLLDSRVPALPEHFDTAQRAWAAFRETSPLSWAKLLSQKTTAMPYLQAVVLRMLEELPSTRNGLSRSERTALSLIADGASAPHQIFAGAQALEERPFMGDWSFWRLLARLARPPEPLIQVEDSGRFFYPPRVPDGPEFSAQRLALTALGREVLENRNDAVRLRGIDAWIGGTHLQAHSVWRWDEER
ncbi:MAG: DUF1835 domain-containing protein, partial [Burkholderiales bacterium]